MTAPGTVLSRRQLNRALLGRQLLLERVALTPGDVLDRLVGMQAQTPISPYVALWSRVDGFTASFNTTLLYGTNIVVDTNTTPATTNITVTNIISLPYNPATYAGDVKVGAMLLVPAIESSISI